MLDKILLKLNTRPPVIILILLNFLYFSFLITIYPANTHNHMEFYFSFLIQNYTDEIILLLVSFYFLALLIIERRQDVSRKIPKNFENFFMFFFSLATIAYGYALSTYIPPFMLHITGNPLEAAQLASILEMLRFIMHIIILAILLKRAIKLQRSIEIPANGSRKKRLSLIFSLFSTKPRLCRIHFLITFVVWNLILYLGVIFFQVYFQNLMKHETMSLTMWITAVFFCTLICVAAVNLFFIAVRRLHDSNFSGWWLLLNFIPLTQFILLGMLLFFRSTPGMNRYGEVSDQFPIAEIQN